MLAGLVCAPVWSVDYFLTQDGPAHAYSASLMLRLLGGDPAAAQLFAFNPWTASSSIGHWLLVLLLPVASPVTATKVMVTLTYVGVVAAVAFLRFATVGRDGVATSLLFGAAIAFNWPWLAGLYNFLIGAIGLAVTLGLFWRWQGGLTPARLIAVSALVLLVYLSHIITFGVLLGALVLVAAFSDPQERRRVCLGLLAALLPVALLASLYGAAAAAPAPSLEPLFPVWRRLSDPWSVVSWIAHVRTADPFFILSRRTLPFTTATSPAFVVFMPLLWLLIAAGMLTWATVSRHTAGAIRAAAWHRLPLVAACAACILVAAFGPDDFGTSRGTLLRERMAILAAILFVPLYRTGGGRSGARTVAHVCLGALILFQTTVVWEYARRTSQDAREFLGVRQALGEPTSLASVIVLENGLRFPSQPMGSISSLLGIGGRAMVWDNYQIGYTLFPVVARDEADRRFAFDLTRANVLDEADPPDVWNANVARLEAFFAAHHPRIETLVVWRGHPQVRRVLERWYDADPFFEHGRARVYRKRPDAGATTSATIADAR